MLLHFGAMGPANGLSLAVEGAAELQRRGCNDAVLVLHGRGKMRAQLEDAVKTKSLRNVIFSDPIPEKRGLAELVAAADVTMTIYKDVPYLRSASPNKMFDSFAAGRPVLTNMPGWLSDLVLENHCGFTTDPQSPFAFADAIERMLRERELLPEMGRNARALAQREFSRDLLANRLRQVLEREARRPT
jgi:glycosyltransferase involved in cell wall biosynthesis